VSGLKSLVPAEIQRLMKFRAAICRVRIRGEHMQRSRAKDLAGAIRWRRIAGAVAGFMSIAVAAYAAIVPVANDSAGAASLAAALSANPALVTGASFESPAPPGVTPNAVADAPLGGFPTNGSTFAILTTGDARLADDANLSSSSGLDFNGGDRFDGPHSRGNTDYDVTVLRINLNVPAASNCLTLDFKFFSEEFPEFVATQYNDAFIAELDASTWTTAGSVIAAPNNFAFDNAGQVVSINSSGALTMNAANAAGTTYDGATPLLSASTPITPGPHTLYLSIFDQGDQIYDSAAFVDNLVVGFVPDPATNCVPGAQPKHFTMTLTPVEDENPEDTEHTVTATLLEDGVPLGGASIEFEVTGVNPATGANTTNAAGQATFTWLGVDEGTDTVTACYQADDTPACEAVASAVKHWLHVNKPPTAACVPTTNPGGKNIPGQNASPKAGMNPDGYYQLLGVDPDSPAPAIFVGDTESSFVAGPYAPGTKVKITQAPGITPRVKPGPKDIEAHIFLNGDARVFAVDDENLGSTEVICYVPRPPK
jgi:hypothetical protein